MPKTDIKRRESEDLKELSDEALDRALSAQFCFTGGNSGPGCAPSD
ncbi:MAG: hypothetical protein ISR48_06200 [Alphaproteobacteria bacterium]|nr:hypothetical protein [Alphaproteobacteria bacterium]